MKQLLFYTWKNFDKDFKKIMNHIEDREWKIDGVYGIPKGGLPLAVKLANELDVPLFTSLNTHFHGKPNILVVDDISDSGQTLKKVTNIVDYKVVTIFKRAGTKFIPNYYIHECTDEWIVFPWEPQDKKYKKDGTKI